MRMQLTKTIDDWKDCWRWWHYMKVYLGFTIWFVLPITIILCTFYFYPLTTISVPSVIMIVALLILLAWYSNPDCWRTAYKGIGTLLQIMMCICYTLYFFLLDVMESYDLNDI